MVQIIRKTSLPDPLELPEGLQAIAREALAIGLREPRPLGFPLLFTSEMALIEPAVQYLHEHGIQRAHTGDTVRTYAEILYDWFETLEQNAIEWDEADAVNLVAYRNRMLKACSGHTNRPYRVSTINHRVRGILRFYTWAVRMGWLENSKLCGPGASFGIARGGDLKDNNVELRDRSFFVLRQFEGLPAPFSPRELREIFAFLKPPYDLIARWQLYTGLRISEVMSLSAAQIVSLGTDTGKPISVVRKGRKTGQVFAPASLVDETKSYIQSYRRSWLQRARGAGRMVDEAPLFINSRGAPAGRSAYQRTIRASVQVIGRRATSHMFRATFACTMLAKLEAMANAGASVNPLLVVKVLMGHEHIETTDRYLRAIAVDHSAIKKALDALHVDAQ